MALFIKSLFWFSIALSYALAEVEIEGKYGWAEKSQTWYRSYQHHRKSLFLKYIMMGKPLNGYHIFVFPITVLISHAHFVMGVPWSFTGELMAMALFLAWAPLWDNLWIIFNPNYGLENAKPSTIWWYGKSKWLLGLFPTENVLQWGVSIGLASVAAYLSSSTLAFYQHIIMLSYFIVFGLVSTFILAPLYAKWYWKMREHDDRNKAGIFH